MVHDSAKDLKWDSNVNLWESKSADISMSAVRTGGDQEPPSQRWDRRLPHARDLMQRSVDELPWIRCTKKHTQRRLLTCQKCKRHSP